MSELSKQAERVRQLALKFPETEQGTSCNNMTFNARGKNFLFLGNKKETYDLRLRLTDSLPEARELGQAGPGKISIGTHGWTHIVLPHAKSLPQALLKRWISESYELLVPKDKAAKSAGTSKKKTATRKKVAKKKSTKKVRKG